MGALASVGEGLYGMLRAEEAHLEVALPIGYNLCYEHVAHLVAPDVLGSIWFFLLGIICTEST